MRRRTKYSLGGMIATAVVASIYVGCGSSSSGANIDLGVGPLAGIFSPTTGDSSRRGGRDGFSLFGASTGCGDGKSLEDQISDIAAAGKLENIATTAAALKNFASPGSFRPSCFGPTWTDDADGSSKNRPSGDLGIVYASASDTDNTACVACEVNALISSGPGLGNRLIKVVALGIAALGDAGKTLPAVGATEDVLATEKFPTIEGATFTSFTIERLEDRDSHAMYLTKFAFTNASGKAGSVTLYHEQLATDNSEFQGLLYATLPHTPTGGSGDTRGISFVYKLSSNIYTFSFKTGANRTTASADFFDSTTHTVDFAKTANGEDMHYILGYFDTANYGGTLHYAWQAGSGDGATRTFAVNVPNAAKGSRTGTGYFGFGTAMTSVTATGVPWMSKMHCNWLHGTSSSPSIAKVQKQVMTDATGDFVASTNNINFAPSDSCDNASWTITLGEATFLNGTRTTVANDLVSAPTSGDFAYNFATAGNEPTFTVP